mmetsp:Transcript_8880/g.21712  ORF Transcript_8880/g.21712 Transcript_8880/m.21712 type:complete len:519 (+) Transcript_8880:2-1558(+)
MATIAMAIDPTATRKLSDMRIGVLDEYLRSSLIPNGLWSDIERNWRYHLRIIAWARKEFLISKYGPYIQEAMVAYPQLKSSPQLSGSSDSGGNRRKLLLDLVHRGVINTDNIGRGGVPTASSDEPSTSPFLMLPSSDVIVKAFRMKGWSDDKSTERIAKSLRPVADKLQGAILPQQQRTFQGGSATTKHIVVPPETDVSSTDLEDILEVVTAGYLKNCGPLNALCQEANFYQLYSREYVQQLGDYLLKRTAARRLSEEGRQRQNGRPNKSNLSKESSSVSVETVVLDIGAGDGVLMHCLRDYMERKMKGLSVTDGKMGRKRKHRSTNSSNERHRLTNIPTIVATDDMSWRINTKAEVEKISVEQALEKYTKNRASSSALNGSDPSKTPKLQDLQDKKLQRPQVIVLCSWMPMGQDWTSHFRNAKVDEYILIGEADDGSCGDNWLTWGNPAFGAHYDPSEETTDLQSNDDLSPIPPYIREGYQRLDLDALTKHQFSSFDLATSKSSKTVSFRKKKTRKK